MTAESDARRILIVKLSAVGDVVMSLPFLAAVKRRFPQARVHWLVEEAASDIVLGRPELDRVIVSPRKSAFKDLKKGRFRTGGAALADLWRRLRAEEYDLAVDLQGLFKSGILISLARTGRRIGFDRTREASHFFLNEKLPPYDPDRHALLRYLDVAHYLGADPSWPVDFHMPRDPAAASRARALLSGLSRPLIAVNPGAKWATKLWPAAHWRALVKRLAASRDVVITGGPDEKALARDAAGEAEVLDLTGKTDLKTLAEVLREADLVVCPDTGPMHLAAAVDTPVVALFGPTSAHRTGPYGSGHVVLTADVDCRPCFRKACPNPRCMTDLAPERVVDAVREFGLDI